MVYLLAKYGALDSEMSSRAGEVNREILREGRATFHAWIYCSTPCIPTLHVVSQAGDGAHLGVSQFVGCLGPRFPFKTDMFPFSLSPRRIRHHPRAPGQLVTYLDKSMPLSLSFPRAMLPVDCSP